MFRGEAFEPRLASIDTHQRFAKSLQVITRQPKIVLLGSSRVYRGFNVSGDIYNMGICSLTLIEASSYIDQVVNFTQAHTIVLGLDFWMFNETLLSETWDPQTGTLSYTVRSFLKALFETKTALHIMKEYFKGNLQPTLDGWSYEGFFRTQANSKAEVDAKLEAYKKSLKSVHIQLDQIVVLERIIRKCKSKGITLYVYISPLHPVTRGLYEHMPNSPSFDTWKKKIRSVCKENDVPFQDLSDLLKNSVPLLNGSDKFWLDYSHFQPAIGEVILQALGLPLPLGTSPQSGKQ